MATVSNKKESLYESARKRAHMGADLANNPVPQANQIMNPQVQNGIGKVIMGFVVFSLGLIAWLVYSPRK